MIRKSILTLCSNNWTSPWQQISNNNWYQAETVLLEHRFSLTSLIHSFMDVSAVDLAVIKGSGNLSVCVQKCTNTQLNLQ